jgi:hypothetical protein
MLLFGADDEGACAYVDRVEELKTSVTAITKSKDNKKAYKRLFDINLLILKGLKKFSLLGYIYSTSNQYQYYTIEDRQ